MTVFMHVILTADQFEMLGSVAVRMRAEAAAKGEGEK